MKLHTKIELLKFCSMVFNFVFLVLGLSVAGCGAWILWDSSFISNISSVVLQLVAVVLVVVGGVVLVVAVLGLVGVQTETRLLLLPAVVLLVLLFLAQAFVTLLLIISRDTISQSLTETVDQLIQQYPQKQPHLLDNLQHYAECCGRAGPSDWLKNSFVQTLNLSEAQVLPCSCFASIRVESGTFCSENLTLTSDLILPGNSSYGSGCATELTDWLRENLYTIIGMDFGLIFIQILLMVLGVTLYKSFGIKSSVKSSEPDLDQDQEQVDSDQDLLQQDQDPGLYHGPYEGPYEEPHEGAYEGPYREAYEGAYEGPYREAYEGVYEGPYREAYEGVYEDPDYSQLQS